MKIRRIGNSLGVSFTKDMLLSAGFSEGDEVEVKVEPGMIRIEAGKLHILSFTAEETLALIEPGSSESARLTAIKKIRASLGKT